jgi:small conductance mechanosensitive channel
MPRMPRRPEIGLDHMFETRTDAWAAAGLELNVNRAAVRGAQRRLAATVPLLIGIIVAFLLLRHHRDWFGHLYADAPGGVKAVTVVLELGFGWLISRDLSRVTPAIFRRMDPATAGTVEFLIRLGALAATVFGALAIAGTGLGALAVGGAFTAIVLGLAAQQTLGNLFAGMVLLSARPFRLGERVRLQAGAVGGQLEGIVSSLGLLYTTLARGEDRIMIPNNVVLAAVVVPLREPEAVDVKVRLNAGVRPTHVQAILDSNVSTQTRKPPNVVLEEIDGDEVVVRVTATPEHADDGAQLADEMIAALASVTGEHAVADPGDRARS